MPLGDPKLNDGFPKFDRNVALGGSVGFMRQLIGYVPIEPDGSVRAKVPANVAFQISVVDANAQEIAAFPRHTAWLTLRPGEVRSCNGCHVPTAGQNGVSGRSHGRDNLTAALNQGQGKLQRPARQWQRDEHGHLRRRHDGAGARRHQLQRLPYNAVNLSANVVFQDAWGDGMVASGNGPISYTYGDLTTLMPIPLACAGAWAAPCRSIIDYPKQISPLWQVSRGNNGVNTCTNCHTSKLPPIPTPVQVVRS